MRIITEDLNGQFLYRIDLAFVDHNVMNNYTCNDYCDIPKLRIIKNNIIIIITELT